MTNPEIIIQTAHPESSEANFEFAGNKMEPDFQRIENIDSNPIGTIVVEAKVQTVRRQGGVAFIVLQGNNPENVLQAVVMTPKGIERETFVNLGLKPDTIVQITGNLQARDEKNIKFDDVAKNPLAATELVAEPSNIRIMVQPEVQKTGVRWSDIVKSGELNPKTYGEVIRLPEFWRMYRLRRDIETTFLRHFTENGFQQIDVPVLTGSISESGAEVFKVTGKAGELSLIQSPQQIKQVLSGLFGRVVWNGQAFRDDPSFTSHHLAEFTGLDVEMQVSKNDKRESMFEVMAHLTDVTMAMVKTMERHQQCLKENGVQIPVISEKGIPVIPFEQAMKISQTDSFNREAERIVGDYIKKTTGSDFYFVEGFPANEKPFYTDYDPITNRSYSFDLIYKGVEISSGGIRINEPKILRQRLIGGKYNPDNFAYYLDHFDRGTSRTGGFGIGLERLIGGTLGTNVRLVTLNPKTAQMSIG